MPRFIQGAKEDPMNTLCRMVVNTKYEDLPSSVINCAKQCILDTIGVTIGGSAMEGIPAVVDFVKDRGGKPESIIPFYGGKVPASEAGLAIGPMARALDMGDVFEAHCSEYTVPTLMASAGLKNKVTGREFITAFTVGQEVLCRVGMAAKGMRNIETGRGNGHFIFGCAAATGKLLGFNLEELENAEGIARGLTQPHDQSMYHPPTLMVRLRHGFIAQDAINACLLAKRGITGTRQGVLTDPKYGYLRLFAGETDPGALTKALGEEWVMLNVIRKPYPCCKYSHSAIDIILDQMREHNFGGEDIAKIEIDESSGAYGVLCVPKEVKWNPQTIQDCQFSLAYPVATAAYNKKLFIDAYTPKVMHRKDIRNLMTRISVKEDPSLPVFAARVRTTLKNGKNYSKEEVYVKGDPKNPMTEQELIDKFKMCVPYSAYKLSDAMVNSIIEAVLGLEEVEDVVRALILPLTPK